MKYETIDKISTILSFSLIIGLSAFGIGLAVTKYFHMW